jgi:calcineurin-like phosphoesterase family protein
MEKIWLITDTHFYHDRIIELAHRPKNYHELIINNWKWLVNEDDTVIHLGDIYFS